MTSTGVSRGIPCILIKSGNLEKREDSSWYLILSKAQGMLLGLIFLFWAKRKYIVESKRVHRYEREHLLEDENPKHFVNRGGVLLKKKFLGFNTYYQNDAEFVEWLKTAYPVIFQQSPVSEEAPKISAAHH